MPTKLGTLSSIYRAYEGPETGGFSLIPQSAVPDVGVDEETRRRLLGDENTPPSWYVGTNTEKMGLGDLPPLPEAKSGKGTLLGTLSSIQANIPPSAVSPSMATTPDAPAVQLAPDVPDTRLVNETVVPKGGAPQQLNVGQAGTYALLDKIERVKRAREEEGKRGWKENYTRSAAKRIGDAILATPGTIGNAGTYIGRSLYSGATKGELPNFSVFPTPSVDDVAAYATSLGGNQTYDQARERLDISEGAREATHPGSTFAGNITGDILTIAGGRTPFSGALVKATRSPEKAEAIRRAIKQLPPSIEKQFKTVWNSESMRSLRRAGGKAAEIGLEGATLGLLHGGDPVTTGAVDSASQLAGSVALSAIKHPVYSLIPIIGAGVMWQMFKDLIPGGRDRILESVEHATHIGAVGTVLGLGATVLGAGRFRGGKGVLPGEHNYPWYGHAFAENVPEGSDVFNSLLRTTPNSIIEQYMNDEKSKAPVIGVVMDKLSTNVSLFTQPEINRLSRTIRTGGSLRMTIQDMLKNPEFASRMGM